MPKLTDTQTIILSAAAQRADNLAMPLPHGLHGAAAIKVITMMIGRGWLEEVDADIRKGESLWRETGDGHGTTLVITDSRTSPALQYSDFGFVTSTDSPQFFPSYAATLVIMEAIISMLLARAGPEAEDMIRAAEIQIDSLGENWAS